MVLYLRHHLHEPGGSGATASVSGPYTRDEASTVFREELVRRFG